MIGVKIRIDKYRGQYINKEGLEWIVGEGNNVKIEVENCTASINGQYIIWNSLEKYQGINENNGEEIWIKFNKE